LAVNKLFLEVFQDIIVQLDLPFEGTIGHAAAALEQGNGLVQEVFKGHYRPSSAILPAANSRNSRRACSGSAVNVLSHDILVSSVEMVGKRLDALPLGMWHVVMTIDGPINMPSLPMISIAAGNLRGPPKVNVRTIVEHHTELIPHHSSRSD
jgi:hypothetical protein